MLRPNILSIYKDKDETRLRHQLNLSELTAVARQRDPKRKAKYVFGVFSPSRNFHLEAQSDKDAQAWVAAIRHEAHIEEEEEMVVTSPGTAREEIQGFDYREPGRREALSSSSEAERWPSSAIGKENRKPKLVKQPSHSMVYSGNEQGSFSDFSDTGGFRGSTLSLSNASPPTDTIYRGSRPSAPRNVSQLSGLAMSPEDERVVFHGWLYSLKSKGGVRQWKKVWAVLRPKCLALYKNEEVCCSDLNCQE